MVTLRESPSRDATLKQRKQSSVSAGRNAFTYGWRDAVFRANPEYDLLRFDRLSAEEQAAYADMPHDAEFYGVLRHRDPARLAKAAGRQTALFFLALKEPGRLPAHALHAADGGQAIAKLVLDHVLQVRIGDAYLGGAEVLRLFSDSPRSGEGGVLAQLSIDALKCAEALPTRDASVVAERLHSYNRAPITPAWRRRLADGAAIDRFLRLDCPELRRRLSRGWTRVEPSAPGSLWQAFRPRTPRVEHPTDKPRFKLYISPTCEAMPDALEGTVGALLRLGHPPFKIGVAAPGLLRPDKMVVHFPTLETLQEAAAAIASALGDLPVQGVPFTAESGGRGLLSWGADPPESEHLRSWQFRGSWRQWLCERLATSLVRAKATPDTKVPSWQYALERLSVGGVDTESWTPDLGLWRSSRAAATRPQ